VLLARAPVLGLCFFVHVNVWDGVGKLVVLTVEAINGICEWGRVLFARAPVLGLFSLFM